ncbi:MAG: molybdenum cofactor biosynthesis protein MoaE [Actinomycetota bacterium]
MNVRVRLFGGLADRVGATEEIVSLDEESTAGQVLEAVTRRHPSFAGIASALQVAVNLEVVPSGHRVRPGDEVALLPPVAGGQVRIAVGLRDRPSVDEALRAVGSPDAGGTVAFVGTVRAEGGRVERLEYSAYEAMAERVLRQVAEEAAAKWPLEGVAVLHGVGGLGVGERTVVVACSAPHRAEAFDACRHVIDEVKRRLPVWKKEVGSAGERWIGLDP